MWKKIVACGMAVLFTVSSASVVGASTNQDELLSLAKTHMGVPYVFGGQSPNGFDCSGYTQYIYNKVGIDIPRTTGAQASAGEKVSKSEMKPGDLVFFENTYKRGISHVGIYVGNNNFISATSSNGIDVVSLNNPYWGPKFSMARRVGDFELNVDSLFTDLNENHKDYKAIKALVDEEIVKGYHDGSFKPDAPVTRGQAAVLVNRILDLDAEENTPFSDVNADHPFAEDIAAMKEHRIIHGYSNGEFKPDESITRGQMAKVLQNALDVSGYSASSFTKAQYHSTEQATRADFARALYDTLYQTVQ